VEYFYIAMAKGGITENHVLIVSVSHGTKNSLYIEGDADKEMDMWKNGLASFFDTLDMYPVFSELYISRGDKNHFHIQVVPVPKSIDVQTVQEAFESVGNQFRMKFNFSNYFHFLIESVGLQEDYFYVQIGDNKRLVCRLQNHIPFSFGRKVICQLLDCPSREDWKSCEQSKKAEMGITNNFRTNFKSFDFTRKNRQSE